MQLHPVGFDSVQLFRFCPVTPSGIGSKLGIIQQCRSQRNECITIPGRSQKCTAAYGFHQFTEATLGKSDDWFGKIKPLQRSHAEAFFYHAGNDHDIHCGVGQRYIFLKRGKSKAPCIPGAFHLINTFVVILVV
ncbi:hypothetical protein D3C74_432840 [compost metagenome]